MHAAGVLDVWRNTYAQVWCKYIRFACHSPKQSQNVSECQTPLDGQSQVYAIDHSEVRNLDKVHTDMILEGMLRMAQGAGDRQTSINVAGTLRDMTRAFIY